ncbi:MAG: hypothetical protein IJW59_00835 [Clostridia bacterium]|nr:hypothetical protein [Clostridia bacterium]
MAQKEKNYMTQQLPEIGKNKATKSLISYVKNRMKQISSPEDFQELYDNVYKKCLLENIQFRGGEIHQAFISEAENRHFKLDLEPDTVPKTNISFDRYSIIPSIKTKQLRINRSQLEQITDIQNLDSIRQIADEYLEVLKTAKKNNWAQPNTNIIHALNYQKAKILEDCVHGLYKDKDIEKYNIALSNALDIKTSFSPSKKTRTIEIEDAIRYVNFALEHYSLFTVNKSNNSYYSQDLDVFTSERKRVLSEEIPSNTFIEFLNTQIATYEQAIETARQKQAERKQAEAAAQKQANDARRKENSQQISTTGISYDKFRKDKRREDEAAGLDTSASSSGVNQNDWGAPHKAPDSEIRALDDISEMGD